MTHLDFLRDATVRLLAMRLAGTDGEAGDALRDEMDQHWQALTLGERAEYSAFCTLATTNQKGSKTMALPEGFIKLSPIPWRYEEVDEYPLLPDDLEDDGIRGCEVHQVTHSGWKDGRFNGTVCDDSGPTASMRADDMPLIAAAPDHALLLAAIVRRVVWISDFPSLTTEARISVMEGMGHGPLMVLDCDAFGCPILTEELRAALIAALEA